MASRTSRPGSAIGRRRWILAAAGLVTLAVVIGVTWGFWRWLDRRELATVVQLQESLFYDESLTKADDRKRVREELLSAIDGLSESQRELLRDRMFDMFRAKSRVKLEAYFEKSEPEKLAFLASEAFRMQSRAEEYRSVTEKLYAGGGQDGQLWRSGSPEQRREMRRRMLDRSTPRERALWSAFFTDLERNRNLLKFPWSR